MGATAVTNVVLNLLLIPRLGYMGAAGVDDPELWNAGRRGRGGSRSAGVPRAGGRSAASSPSLGSGWHSPRLALLGPDHIAWRIACIMAYPVIAIGLRILPGGLLKSLAALLRRRWAVSGPLRRDLVPDAGHCALPPLEVEPVRGSRQPRRDRSRAPARALPAKSSSGDEACRSRPR